MKNFRIDRVFRICSELSSKICKNSFQIDNWKLKDGFYLTPEEADKSKVSWRDFDNRKDVWTGHDKHYWFRTSFLVPKNFHNESIWISIRTQVDTWDGVNPQFLLFINGDLTQGVDGNHKDIKISANLKESEEITIDLQAYSGADNMYNSETADRLRLFCNIYKKDELIEEAYYNLHVLNKVASHLKEDCNDRNKIQLILENAINMLDLREPYSETYYESLKNCNLYLNKEIFEKENYNDVIATCIGHTHIDVAWWWSVEQTREKAVRSFATVLKYMEEYPEYKFMSSQPQLYKFVKDRYPLMFDKIKKKVKEGKWEPAGGMWLEADCNLTSGESLVRQFLHGKNFFKKEFDIEDNTLWLPDVFGYTASLPQIMEKSGIKYFMTTKIAWNEQNQLPYDTFWWKGIDGTKVFTHLITTQEDKVEPGNFFTVYNGHLTPIAIMRAWERYQQKELNNDVLVSYGYGDGGGGPTREMIETGRRLEKGIPGVPKVRFDNTKTFFDEAYEKMSQNNKLPIWNGELYLELHRGTYTSMARNKKSNRICERLWQDVEFLSVIGKEIGETYKGEEIYNAWEIILLNQFHDILPGTSVKEVYDVTKKEYEYLETKALKWIKEITEKIVSKIGAEKDELVLFNTVSFDRNDTVIVDGYKGVKSFIDEQGNKLLAQTTKDNKIIFTPTVRAKGFSKFKPSFEEIIRDEWIKIDKNIIETTYYKMETNYFGAFTSIFDKENNREVLRKGELGNVLKVYEDMPIFWDNWDIAMYYDQKSYLIDDLISSQVVENNGIRAIIRNEYKFMDSVIIQDIIFYSESRRIDFETYVDWKQHHLLLKTEFDVDINANEATYDIQFGNIKRPTHQNTSWDKAKFEVCAHKWADLSEGDYGFSILNDCKYGHSIQNGKITLSLIKSGTMPNVTDQEEHKFTYSILPHSGDFIKGKVQNEGIMLNSPVYSVIAKESKEEIKFNNFISIDKENVIVETIKEALDGNGTIIRVIESQNARTYGKITLHKKYKKIIECNLMEDEIQVVKEDDDKIEFTIKPFEIKTFRLC